MKSIFLARNGKRCGVSQWVKGVFLFLLTSACLTSSILAGEVGQASLLDMMNYSQDSQGIRNDVMTSGDACPTREELITKTKTLQMPFIANNGQVDGQVAFYAKTFGGTVFVTKEGEIVYALPDGRQGGRGVELVVAYVYLPFLHADNTHCSPDRVFAKSLIAAYLPGLQKGTDNPHSAFRNPKSPIKGVALKETIIGAKIGGITGEQPAVTTVNYFTGNDKSKWKTNVPTYDIVNLGEVYKGIELSLKAYGDNVEKLFCVKPGASPELITVQLDGSKSLRVNQDGQLEVDTELGQVKFTRPIAYQEIAGKRVEVACKYTIAECGVQNAEYKTNPQSTTSDSPIPHSASEYSFTVASYDKTKDLIIDPLLVSTYLGGGRGGEDFNSLILDTSGDVYVTGVTFSSDFPTTSGAYDTSLNGPEGYADAFVSKLNSGLTSLLASTFLGGSDGDIGYSLTLDTSGNVYVTGFTASTNFPTASGAYDISYRGLGDVFVSKLDGGLTSLLASTFLGGESEDLSYSIALDTGGNVCVTGFTQSQDFPTTKGAYDTTGNFEGFVSKLDGNLSSEISCTYSISPISKSFSNSGGTGSVGVYASSSNCTWTAVSNVAWITVTSGGSGTGNGTVAYSVLANTGSARTGTMTIAARTFTITQDSGISCTYTISPISKSFSNSGGTGSVGVTASSSSCTWTDVSNAAWITVTSGGSGTGNGTVAYSVSANTGTSARTGTITIAGQTFTVTQEGSAQCKAKSITAAPKNLSLTKNGNGDVTITVKGAGNCLVEGATVTATISGNGNQIIAVSPVSQATDANGQAIFAMNAKDKKGTAAIRFRANGMSKSTTVKVKVR
ncbi:MAG: hypothetical protein HW390_2585 [Candidatus Brocadiaceae bacterium]|nr:hypothetical protein [Candidatus Brocadiaceae bacterium]